MFTSIIICGCRIFANGASSCKDLIYQRCYMDFSKYIYIWISYNDLTVLPHWNHGFHMGNHPQMVQQFRLVKYYNLPRIYIYIYYKYQIQIQWVLQSAFLDYHCFLLICIYMVSPNLVITSISICVTKNAILRFYYLMFRHSLWPYDFLSLENPCCHICFFCNTIRYSYSQSRQHR